MPKIVLKTFSLKLIYFDRDIQSLWNSLQNCEIRSQNFKQFYLVQVIKNDAYYRLFICNFE